MRTTGPSSPRSSAPRSARRSPPPNPPNVTASWATTTRLVLATDPAMASVSSGTRVRGSRTSTIPSASRPRAARSACPTMAPRATTVRRRPLVRRAPFRARGAYRSAGTAPARRRRGASARGTRRGCRPGSRQRAGLRVVRAGRHHDQEPGMCASACEALRVLRTRAGRRRPTPSGSRAASSRCRPS